jgi:hypothetical protein
VRERVELMSDKRSQKNIDVWSKAVRRFDVIYAATLDERRQCKEDRRFYSIAGAQWEGKLGDQFENKPKLEVNKTHLSVIRIINEYRNNRITVNYESDTKEELADLCDGLYRQDENRSGAQEAYDNAFEEGVGGGMGAFRFIAEYRDDEDPDDDEQCIAIEPVYDADSSVYFDLDAKKQDKSDAKFCFVLTRMSPEAYEDEYGESPTTWSTDDYTVRYDWATPDVVTVAEYFIVEEVKVNVHHWVKLDGEKLKLSDDELEDQREMLNAVGAEEIRIKKVKKRKVRKYILSGGGVLDDNGYIAGRNIPVIPVYGKRWYVDNVERCMGHVRLAKDPQRIKNMQVSKLAEISALSSVSKPIVTPEQILGHQEAWKNDNIENFPYLLLNPIKDANGQALPAGPLAYTKPPEIPPALAALLQITEADLADILGNSQDGEEISGNVSTQTAELIQTRLDMQTYIYLSNMAKAIKRGGEIWLSMAKDVYVEKGRVVRVRGPNGEIGKKTLLDPKLDKHGKEVTLNDLSEAKFDVVTEVGPSSSTKKAATIRQLLNLMQITQDPLTQKVLSSMIIQNMDGDGLADVRDYFRQEMIKMQVVKPTEEEAAELAEEQKNQEPSANDKYLEAAATAEEARAIKAQSDALLQDAKTDKTRAETVEVMTGMENDSVQQSLDIIEKLGPNVTDPTSPGSSVK